MWAARADGEVEGEILGDPVARSGALQRHRLAERVEVGLSAPHGREFRRARFQMAAQLEDLPHLVEGPRLPARHPERWRARIVARVEAATATRFDQSARLQLRQRLAQHRPADTKARGEVVFRRQARAGRQAATLQPRLQRGDDGVGEVLARLRRFEVHRRLPERHRNLSYNSAGGRFAITVPSFGWARPRADRRRWPGGGDKSVVGQDRVAAAAPTRRSLP